MSFEKRETAGGFLQFRERYDDGKASRWQYQIYAFSGEPGTLATCSVYAVDGKRECPIDARNRLYVDGRWHGPRSWDH